MWVIFSLATHSMPGRMACGSWCYNKSSEAVMKLLSLPGLGLSMNTCALHYMVIRALERLRRGVKEQRKIIDHHGAFFSTLACHARRPSLVKASGILFLALVRQLWPQMSPCPTSSATLAQFMPSNRPFLHSMFHLADQWHLSGELSWSWESI